VEPFRRDRLTWLTYLMLAWFGYLQATPGLVVPHLREELGLSYSAGGLHVAAFACGSFTASLLAGPLERRLGRRAVFWLAATVMAAGALVLATGRIEPLTLAGVLVMGFGGGMLLVTIQAALSDRHGERRAVALAEANVAASAAYVVVIGALSLAAAVGAGWRAAVLAILIVPPVAWLLNRREPIEAPPIRASADGSGTLPAAFWIATAMIFCTTAAEWCINAWGASFVQDAAGVSADTAVALMGGWFAGVLAGRIAGSRLARRHSPQRLLLVALATGLAGFAILWSAGSPAQALVGLTVIGLGVGNLFPFGLAFTLSLAPANAQRASARAATVTASSVLLAPLTVGTLADATSLSAALAVVPVALALAATLLAVVTRRAGLRLAAVTP
jgi:fucose permease